jgi:hypothetical protein
LASGLWLFGRLPESPQAALPNNNDNYYAYKGEYFANYRICDPGKHIPADCFLKINSPLSLWERVMVRAYVINQIYMFQTRLSTTD